MEVVWAQGWHEFAVVDVHRLLSQERDIAYTTVMTTVGRLHEKGLLSRAKDGKRYVYRSRMTRDEFNQRMAKELWGSLAELGHDQALALLVDRVAESDKDELRKLEAMIRKKKKELDS